MGSTKLIVGTTKHEEIEGDLELVGESPDRKAGRRRIAGDGRADRTRGTAMGGLSGVGNGRSSPSMREHAGASQQRAVGGASTRINNGRNVVRNGPRAGRRERHQEEGRRQAEATPSAREEGSAIGRGRRREEGAPGRRGSPGWPC